MSEIIALVGKGGLPLIPAPNSGLRSFQPTAPIHLERYIHGVNGNAPVIRGDTTLILDSRIFEGGALGIKMRDYLRAIRNKYPDTLILCLRQDIEDKSHERNDIQAGATATLFYMGNISDATRRMNAFMDTGELPKPRQGRSSAVVSGAPFNGLFHHAGDASDDEGALGNVEPVKPVARSSPVTQAVQSSRATTSARSSMVSAPKTSSKSKPVAPPTSTEEPALGDQEMKELLEALNKLSKTLTDQNTQILAVLTDIQNGLGELRSDRENEFLASMRAKVGTAMDEAFAQLRSDGKAHSTMIPTLTTATVVGSVSAGIQTTSETEKVPPSMPEPTSKETEPIAMLTKHGWNGAVTLFGRTIELSYGAAKLFTHLVNTGETMGTSDIASLYQIGKQGGYFRMNTLHKDLETFQKGLSSCLTLVQSSNSKNYRFNEGRFREILKIK